MSAVLVADPLQPVRLVIEPERRASAISRVIETYARLLLAGFALIPAALIGYLFVFQDPARRFEDHAFHVIAIAVATLEGLFVCYLPWGCYRGSGTFLGQLNDNSAASYPLAANGTPDGNAFAIAE